MVKTMASDINYERRKAVASAWKQEKNRVVEGKGTRDWTQAEQREIILKGKAKGYEGHHMKSVDGHNSRAGDPNNIQFLTRKEHFAAHNKNFHNNTNGYYNPKTGVMTSFGCNKPSIKTQDLSNPLSARQIKGLSSKAATNKKITEAKNMAKGYDKRPVNKTKNTLGESQSKTLTKQRSLDRRKEAASKVNSKTLSRQKAALTATKSKAPQKKSKVHTH